MTAVIRLFGALAALTVTAIAFAQSDSSAPQQRFIACPTYRDTNAGRKSGCWLANEPSSGHRFDISQAPTKPDWNHEVLVEGALSPNQDNACGAFVLAPVRVSVLPGPCTRHMLPAEGFPGRRFVLPQRNIRPTSEPRKAPEGAPSERTFYLFYDFDSSFLVYQLDDYFLEQAATYIHFTSPRRIVVTGFAATTATSVSGRRIAERSGLARERAQSVAESLRRLGTSGKLIVRWKNAAAPRVVKDADGLIEPSRRRVEIDTYP